MASGFEGEKNLGGGGLDECKFVVIKKGVGRGLESEN